MGSFKKQTAAVHGRHPKQQNDFLLLSRVSLIRFTPGGFEGQALANLFAA